MDGQFTCQPGLALLVLEAPPAHLVLPSLYMKPPGVGGEVQCPLTGSAVESPTTDLWTPCKRAGPGSPLKPEAVTPIARRRHAPMLPPKCAWLDSSSQTWEPIIISRWENYTSFCFDKGHLGRIAQWQSPKLKNSRAPYRLRNREKFLWLTGGRFPEFFNFL